MKKRLKRPSEDGAIDLDALRAVLRETGGQAKVDELYRMLDAEEVAHFLKLSVATVYDMFYRNELPCTQVTKRAVRVSQIALIHWCAERKRPTQR
jgi:predicted DNA-binding transcriptional regulator AlpA